jgi:phosphate transport system permease protein
VTAIASPPTEAAVEVRRSLHQVRSEEVFAAVGCGVAALSLTYLVYFLLLPFTGALGFVVTSFFVYVGLYALHTALTADGPQVADRIARVTISSTAAFMILVLAVVVSFTFKRGWAALEHTNFFTHDLSRAAALQPLTEGGVLHAMVGTLIMITIALVITIPVGLVAALYLSEARGAFARLVRTIVEAMTALPSVIAGLFVYAVILYGVGLKKSGLAAALALSVMMLPIIIRAADVVLRLVPGTLKEAAAALGASRWRIAWQVVLPTSRSGLMTAIILGAARGIGETSPVLLTAGYTAAFTPGPELFGHQVPDPTNGPMVSLPLATFILTRSPEPNQIARGFGAAAVLMVVVLLLFVVARILGGQQAGELSPRQRKRAARQSKADLERLMSTRELAAMTADQSNGRQS